MDSVTALTGLLVAGASVAAKEVAGQAVKDLYAGLKTALKRILAKPDVVDDVEENPDDAESKAAVEAELRSNEAAIEGEVAELAAKLAKALSDMDAATLERAGIEIGDVVAAQNAILKDFDAEGGIRIASVTAQSGDAVITGLSAGRTDPKK